MSHRPSQTGPLHLEKSEEEKAVKAGLPGDQVSWDGYRAPKTPLRYREVFFWGNCAILCHFICSFFRSGFPFFRFFRVLLFFPFDQESPEAAEPAGCRKWLAKQMKEGKR